MNYQKVYDQFIQDRLNNKNGKCKYNFRPSSRRDNSDFEGYCEVHHIVPGSLGGSDKSDNLIRLSAGDHLFAHALLARIYKAGMVLALHRMLNCSGNIKSKRYSTRVARVHLDFIRSNIKFSQEHKDKLRKSQPHSKVIIQQDLNFVIVGIYDNAKQAALLTRSIRNHISNCANGRRKTHNGFYWSHQNFKPNLMTS